MVGRVREIRIYPYLIGRDRPGSLLGYPRVADAEKAKALIERLNRFSHPYGTEISTKDGIARVVVGH